MDSTQRLEGRKNSWTACHCKHTHIHVLNSEKKRTVILLQSSIMTVASDLEAAPGSPQRQHGGGPLAIAHHKRTTTVLSPQWSGSCLQIGSDRQEDPATPGFVQWRQTLANRTLALHLPGGRQLFVTGGALWTQQRSSGVCYKIKKRMVFQWFLFVCLCVVLTVLGVIHTAGAMAQCGQKWTRGRGFSECGCPHRVTVYGT